MAQEKDLYPAISGHGNPARASPRWRRESESSGLGSDGKTLFFNPGPGLFKSVSVTTEPVFAFGNPVSLARPFRAAPPWKPRDYDVTPDGRFIAAIDRGQY